ncbi:hypothetical protein WH47_07076, partial [Habropoda laboriosa]
HLFRSTQYTVKEQHFKNLNKERNLVDNYLAYKQPAFFHCGIQLLLEKWKKIIQGGGHYFN